MLIHLKETILKLAFTIVVVKTTIVGGNIKLKIEDINTNLELLDIVPASIFIKLSNLLLGEKPIVHYHISAYNYHCHHIYNT
jgi:hypothetical protein